MSELLRTSEKESKPEAGEASVEALNANNLEAAKKAEVLDVTEARSAIEKAEPDTKEMANKHAEIEEDNSSDVRWWSKELGRQNLDRTLASVRRSLSAPEQQLSKFIHRPVVEKVSDLGGKTIARPSGILLGGIFSFVGSLGVYLLAKHLGGELRYSIFAITFVFGFILGLIVELLWRIFSRKKSS